MKNSNKILSEISRMFLIVPAFILLITLSTSSIVLADRDSTDPMEENNKNQINNTFTIEDLTGELTPEDIAVSLVGSGVTISNISYTGANVASGIFSGGDGIIAFNSGIVLTSGSAKNVIGPNVSDSISLDNGLSGDTDLNALAGYQTYDASVLQFDFVTAANTVFFRFVFASDEYNEFVNSQFNDVFAFFINGQNCATVEDDPVSVNTINYGNPYGFLPYSHPELYINNDLSDGGGSINTEMDGLTDVLTCSASVTPNQTNTMKLAIADASDHVYDSAVFIEGASLTGSQVIELTGLEVTQAIQNWENDGDVPLIEDKPTFVRAHVKSISETIYNVKAELIGRSGGNPLPGSPLTPDNLGIQLDVKPNPSRITLSDSFYFELPRSWMNNTIELEFRGITHSISCKDHTGVHNDCKVSVTFQETNELDVRLVGLTWEENNIEHSPDWSEMLQVVDEIEAIYPIDTLDYDWIYNLKPLLFPGAPRTALDWIRRNMMTWENRVLDCTGGPCPDYYLGIAIDLPANATVTGLGGFPNSSIAGAYITKKFTPAHELGHALGRPHTLCRGDEGGPGPYPYPGGQISPDMAGDKAFYGFNISNLAIYPPKTGDLMSYCGPPRWTSDWTYRLLRDSINAVTSTSRSNPNATYPVILVSGIISPTINTGTIQNVIRLESITQPSVPEPGDYILEFRDINGNPQIAYSFIPDEMRSEGAYDPYLGFVLVLPWTDDAKNMTLLHEGIELASVNSSAHVPTINVLSPNGGEYWDRTTGLVTWEASDLDVGETLSFTIQYSRDGGATWMTLVSKIHDTQYAFDLKNLPGSSEAMIRIFASDGFLSAMDSSNSVFVIEDSIPFVDIRSPETGGLFIGNQVVVLDGSGYDNEDGKLSGENMIWSSDLNGVLGYGEKITVTASMLTEGIQTINLLAQDSLGHINFDTTSIQIYRSRPTIEPRLEVSPQDGSFSLIASGPKSEWQDMTIRNLGDGTITWFATPSDNWIVISDTTDFTPSDNFFAIDPATLQKGIYTGTITITGTEAINSPQYIYITVEVFNKVTANFTASMTSGRAPFTVDFSNQSSGDYSFSNWDFGDGNKSDLENPIHTYTQPGNYSVTLTVFGSGGMASITEPDLIFVEPGKRYVFLPVLLR